MCIHPCFIVDDRSGIIFESFAAHQLEFIIRGICTLDLNRIGSGFQHRTGKIRNPVFHGHIDHSLEIFIEQFHRAGEIFIKDHAAEGVDPGTQFTQQDRAHLIAARIGFRKRRITILLITIDRIKFRIEIKVVVFIHHGDRFADRIINSKIIFQRKCHIVHTSLQCDSVTGRKCIFIGSDSGIKISDHSGNCLFNFPGQLIRDGQFPFCNEIRLFIICKCIIFNFESNIHFLAVKDAGITRQSIADPHKQPVTGIIQFSQSQIVIGIFLIVFHFQHEIAVNLFQRQISVCFLMVIPDTKFQIMIRIRR